MHRKAFTLIELLVVIAIIAILAAILFPVFANARRQAKVTTCVSNARQVGLAVRMYVDDNNATWPIFQAYNKTPSPWEPGHLGIEMALLTYTKDKRVFDCPEDIGSPFQEGDVPKSRNYWEAYGSSYRFDHCGFSTIANYSSQNGNVYPDGTTQIVKDAAYQLPAQTRIIRDEEFPFFSKALDPQGGCYYGYECAGYDDYFREWHRNGGSMIFADGHAKFITSAGAFDKTLVSPSGHASGETHPDPNIGTWYWACD